MSSAEERAVLADEAYVRELEEWFVAHIGEHGWRRAAACFLARQYARGETLYCHFALFRLSLKCRYLRYQNGLLLRQHSLLLLKLRELDAQVGVHRDAGEERPKAHERGV